MLCQLIFKEGKLFDVGQITKVIGIGLSSTKFKTPPSEKDLEWKLPQEVTLETFVDKKTKARGFFNPVGFSRAMLTM